MKIIGLHVPGALHLLLVWLQFSWIYDAVADESVRDRFARLRDTEEWRPESTIPVEPQEAPDMLIWEVTREPSSIQTPEQKRLADELVENSYRAAEQHGWFDVEIGVRDGYSPMYGDRTHYANEEYILDGVVLDPDRPEFLMYYESEGRKVLAGMMFLVSEPLAYGPQIGGPETLWHYHRWSRPLCLLDGLLVVGERDETGMCARGTSAGRSPEMIHVWLVDHPKGRFTTNMALDSQLLRQLVEIRKAKRGFLWY